MNQLIWLLTFFCFGEGAVILYLLGMVKDSSREHTRALKSVVEDVLLSLKAKDSVEYSHSRAFQKDTDSVREATEIIPAVPFNPSQANPSPNTYTDPKTGRELNILRPRV